MPWPSLVPSCCSSAAAVEFAAVLPLLVLLLIGVWEIGRLIQLQQIMNNAARAGARLASQATIINSDGTTTNVATSTGSPNVTSTVSNYLQAAGITNLTGLQVSFQFTNGNTSLTDPYQGTKNQQYCVSVTLPYANLRWTNLSLINPTTLGGQCTWQLLVDAPFSVTSTLPGWSP